MDDIGIVSVFKDVLSNYRIVDNNVVLEDSDIVSRMEGEYCDVLSSFVRDVSGCDDYIVSFETSKNGVLFRVPVVTIFNRNFSESYNDGLFLGFSFYPSGGFVYFKLDQGIRSTGGDFDLFFVRAEKLRQDYIHDVPSEFKFDEKKCGAGNIIGRNYSFDELNIELLTKDLKYLLNVYEDIIQDYENIKKLSFNEIVNSINI